MSNRKKPTEVETHFGGYTISQGQLISDRVQRIVEAIRDYEPEIEVRWIPDRQALEDNLPQFKIVHCQPGQPEFILFHVKNEEEFDETILLRIIENDQRNGAHKLSDFEAAEKTRELINKQLWLDHMEEANSIAAAVWKSPLNTYKINKDLVIKDGIPFNAAHYNK